MTFLAVLSFYKLLDRPCMKSLRRLCGLLCSNEGSTTFRQSCVQFFNLLVLHGELLTFQVQFLL